ncbi:MAG TPA: F-box protein [Gammaproteobacteria bacterium]|nr:F-box protein [Gammaproteobacteria bacterium]
MDFIKRRPFFCISIFLSPEHVANASAVCKVWKQSLDKPTVWKKQHEIQGYVPIHPVVEKCLQGSDGSRFSSDILTIIANYDDPRVLAYKAVFAAPILNAITTRTYETHFRDTRVLNPIPRPGVMRRENNKPNPDCPGKTIGETHIWTYRPRLQINGIVTTLTMNILEQLVQNPLQGHRTKFEYVTPAISQEQRNASLGEEGWYLMPNTVCERTRNLLYDQQVEIVRSKGYEIPSGPDVILTALVWHVLKGEYPFGRAPLTYTRTTSLTANGNWHWAVGAFGPSGFRVSDDVFGRDACIGLAGLRKFS